VCTEHPYIRPYIYIHGPYIRVHFWHPYIRAVCTGSAYRSPVYAYGPYIRVHFLTPVPKMTRTYGPYIRAVARRAKPRPITIDTNILCGTVGDVTQRHSLRATGSICHRIFVVERIRPILQVLCSDLELVKWVWSKMTLRIFCDARTHSSGPTMIASRHWFLYTTATNVCGIQDVLITKKRVNSDVMFANIYSGILRKTCTGRIYGPYIRVNFLRPVHTGRKYGCQKCTRTYGPYIRPVRTGRMYG